MSISKTELWCIGVNTMTELKPCEFTEKITNITHITRGSKFNIFTVNNIQKDDYTIYGFMRESQQLFPYQTNSFYLIPSDVIVLCLKYFGNNTYIEYWSAGDNWYGQCGVGNNHITHIDKAIKIKEMTNISKICAGNKAEGLLWITNDGLLYINGRNHCNQFGINNNNKYIASPILLHYFNDKGLKVIDGAVSNTFCMVICNDGSVWSSGIGYSGQLGLNQIETNQFTKLKYTNDIVSVCVSDDFSLFLDKYGYVSSCGDNDNGCLGNIQYFIMNYIRIKHIDCGWKHCIALCENGNIYEWGWTYNYYGQHKILKTPVKMKFFENKNEVIVE
eukprot:449631_1